MRIKLNHLCVVICGLLPGLLFSLSVGAGEGERLLDSFLTKTQTMSAAFTQTLKSDEGRLLQESVGRFYLQRPGRFRWDYTSPYEQQIVCDGERIWVFDVDLEQVTVRKADAGGGNTPMALIESRSVLQQAYEIHERGVVDGLHRVELVSRNDDGDFSRVMLGLDESGLVALQLFDRFEQTTDIRFTELKSNLALDPALFEFTPPQGVDVLGGS